jgi:hypothetical protein
MPMATQLSGLALRYALCNYSDALSTSTRHRLQGPVNQRAESEMFKTLPCLFAMRNK